MTVISYYYIGPPLKFTQDSTPTRLGIHVVPSNNEAERRQKMSQSTGQSVCHLFEKHQLMKPASIAALQLLWLELCIKTFILQLLTLQYFNCQIGKKFETVVGKTTFYLTLAQKLVYMFLNFMSYPTPFVSATYIVRLMYSNYIYTIRTDRVISVISKWIPLPIYLYASGVANMQYSWVS